MKSLLSFLAFAVYAITISAQVNLEVNVVDLSNNQPLENVTVVLSNAGIGYEASLQTSSQGKALFTGLSLSGIYTATVKETDNFFEEKASGIVLRTNYTASVSIGMRPRKDYELEEVVIGGNVATRINAINAEVASSLSQEEVENLPIEGRDITRVLFRLPNVTQATGFYPEAPNVSINGANSLYNNYLIDGMDNNERFLGGQKFRIPVGFTKDVTVLTNNYSTEFGNTANGVINITSRSGSNDFSGEAFFVTRPGAVLDAESPFIQRDLSGNQVKDGFQRYQAGFAFGGAIKKDKTFYYVNAEQIIDLKDNLLNVPQLGVNETVRGTNRFTLLSAKLDHHWSNRFRSSIRVNGGLVNIDRQGGGLEGGVAFPSSGNSQDRNSLLIASKNTYVGDNFLSETNLQYASFRWNYGKADQINSPQVSVLDPDGFTIAVLGHPGYIFDAHENTLQFQQKFTFLAGRHTIKTGAEIISADHELFGGGNVNGNYLVQLNADQLSALRTRNLGSALNVNDIPSDVEVLNYNVELRPAAFGKRQTIYSVYVEDQYSASNRLNLTLGLRYDYDDLSRGAASSGDLNNLAPRFSFNYKLDNKSSLRGGYGIFYDKVLYAIHSDALQQNTTDADYRKQIEELVRIGQLPADTDVEAALFDGNLGGTQTDVAYRQGATFDQLQEQRQSVFSGERRILNPNGYDNPLSHQFSLGYQHQVNDNVLFYVDVIHNRTSNLFRLRNLNGAAAYPINDPANVIVRTQAEADASRPIPILSDSLGNYALIDGERVRGVARNVVISESGGESRYWAASFNLQKERGNDNYSFRLIYTLSELRNNTEDINFRAMDGNDFEAEWGPSINDRTHVLNGFVNYYPIDNLSFSLAMLLQSGQPINRIPNVNELDANGNPLGTTDLNGDGRSFGDAYVGNSDRYPGESRNSDRLPWANTFDIGVQYEIPAGPNKIRLRADVFNVFNAANLSGYFNNATQSNQVQAGSTASGVLVRRNASPPRQVQLSANYYF
ncbi:MAG: TonB-dependent receptor [Bacteroidota bacterium]